MVFKKINLPFVPTEMNIFFSDNGKICAWLGIVGFCVMMCLEVGLG